MRTVKGVLLFDGFCVLCSGFVRRLIKKYDASLQLVPMQSPDGQKWLTRYGLDAEPDEVILLLDQRVLKGVRAVLFLMEQAGGWWKFLGNVASLFPDALLNWLYRRIANNRFLLFGKRSSCYNPRP
jgi:predicted DCC family thiol-disulfide oxidoreductase YuxK